MGVFFFGLQILSLKWLSLLLTAFSLIPRFGSTLPTDADQTSNKQGGKLEVEMILAEGPQVVEVTAISNDDAALEATLGYDVRLDKEWTVCQSLEKADPSARALLVRQDCAWGAVRVDSIPVSNVVTGQGNDFYIVYIDTGQSCLFLRQPSVRFFHRR
ncbi:hypothetical protein QBC47DRAFT_429588 [Echria macrotheca]|uniref:Uncharacterized protein n=1 Tax=Echria macrotheca TaxID=438768 RepID=A0AAJ0BB43_9PEZI|nr:hypothetical protein QBC47DRAFT_429588 [Echria macrotheca]